MRTQGLSEELRMKLMTRTVSGSLLLALALCIPALAQATFDKALALEKQGRYAEAQKAYEEVLAREGNNAMASYRLGQLYLYHLRRSDLAIQYLEKAVALDEKNSDYHLRLAEAYTAAAPHAGIIKRTSMTRQIKNQLDLALQYNSRSIPAHQGLIQFYVQAPAVLGGSYRSAHQQADSLVRLDAVEGWLAHGGIYYLEGSKGKAEEAFRKAIAANPRDSRGYRELGQFYVTEKRFDDAIAQLKKHVELNPASGPGYYSLGEAYSGRQMYREALSAYLQALQKDANVAPAYFEAAQCHERLGQKQDALKYYRLFVARFPGAPRAPAAKQKIAELSRG